MTKEKAVQPEGCNGNKKGLCSCPSSTYTFPSKPYQGGKMMMTFGAYAEKNRHIVHQGMLITEPRMTD
jgi:hypothetical protein